MTARRFFITLLATAAGTIAFATTSGWSSARRTKLTWWRSKNGTEPWRLWKEHVFDYRPSYEAVDPVFGFAGRFGRAPGGGTLVIDPNRFGHFFSRAEIDVGANPDWRSVFPY